MKTWTNDTGTEADVVKVLHGRHRCSLEAGLWFTSPTAASPGRPPCQGPAAPVCSSGPALTQGWHFPSLWGLGQLQPDPLWEQRLPGEAPGSWLTEHRSGTKGKEGTLINCKRRQTPGHWTCHAQSWTPGGVQAEAHSSRAPERTAPSRVSSSLLTQG